MTISSTGTRYSYSGNGATTVFSFPRQFFANTDLKVYLVDDATGVATLQTLSTHYTLSGAGSPSGGNVTMLAAPATGKTLVIYRDTPLTQSLDLDNVTSFPMTSIEAAFDRAMMAIDELATKLGRAVLAPLSRIATFDYTLPAPVASKILGINAAGTAFELREPQSWTSGSGDPASSYGSVGDYYFNTASGDVFKKIGASTWSLIGNMVGPQGEQGTLDTSTYLTSLGIGSLTQAWDADLDAFAALAATAGFIKKTGANAYTIDTATYLTTSAAAAAYQPLDADLTAWAGKTAPSGVAVGTTDTQTLTNKTLTSPVITGAIAEDVFTITDAAAFEIDPSNGTMQNVTLGASRTPKATNFANGESVTLRIKDGTAYTVTWTDATFGGSGVVWVGATAPTLDTTNWTVVVLWKEGGQVYGKYIGVVV